MLTSTSLVLHSLALRLRGISLLVNQRMIKAAAILQCQDGWSPGVTQNQLLFGITVGKTGWNWIMNHREKCGPGLRHIYRQLFLSLPMPSLSFLLFLITYTLFRTHTYIYPWKHVLLPLMAVTLIFCFWCTQDFFFFSFFSVSHFNI